MNHSICFFSLSDLIANRSLTLPQAQVHIWSFSEAHLGYFSSQSSVLSQDELKVCNSYKHLESKNCYLIGHSALRLILGRYLNISPSDLVFFKNEHGKLYLDTQKLNYDSNIQFNISHSGGHILIAFCRFSEIGIDLEKIYMHRQVSSIVKRFYHPDEWLEFQNISEDEKGAWFYKRWTVREAFLKAIGTGLTIDPESFYTSEISITNFDDIPENNSSCNSTDICTNNSVMGDTSLYRFQIQKSQEDYSSWQIYTFTLFDDYIVSVCFL